MYKRQKLYHVTPINTAPLRIVGLAFFIYVLAPLSGKNGGILLGRKLEQFYVSLLLDRLQLYCTMVAVLQLPDVGSRNNSSVRLCALAAKRSRFLVGCMGPYEY